MSKSFHHLLANSFLVVEKMGLSWFQHPTTTEFVHPFRWKRAVCNSHVWVANKSISFCWTIPKDVTLVADLFQLKDTPTNCLKMGSMSLHNFWANSSRIHSFVGCHEIIWWYVKILQGEVVTGWKMQTLCSRREDGTPPTPCCPMAPTW